MSPHGPGAPWWQGGVIYQIYVRSWYDNDRQGYGDLAGVIDKLDYLAWLGVDAIWLSPTMPSPDEDWGYDVSDYFGVQPELGGPSTLDRLTAEARDRGLAVLLDLVPNHTSSQHPWFLDARSSRQARHRDWYVWADPRPDGSPPNNWLDSTGRSAWTLDATERAVLPAQLSAHPARSQLVEPDRTGRLRRDSALLVRPGRVRLPDRRRPRPVPRRPAAGQPSGRGPGPDARFGQQEIYSKNRPEVHEVYRRWRRIAEQYSPPRLLLGETFVLDLDRLRGFYGDNDELQLAFNFSFRLLGLLGACPARSVVGGTLERLPAGACPVWTGSNHDVSRFPDQMVSTGDERKMRLALLILCSLPGTIVLYYGDEIGMAGRRDGRRRPAGPDDAAGRRRGFTATTPAPPCSGPRRPGAGFTQPDVRPWLPFGDYRQPQCRGPSPGSRPRSCRSARNCWSCATSTFNRVSPPMKSCPARMNNGCTGAGTCSSPPTSPTRRHGRGPPGDIVRSSLDPERNAEPCRRGGLELQPWEGVILKMR